MKTSERAKEMGCDSLKQVILISNTSHQTLHNWHKNNRRRFDVICLGVAQKAKMEESK